MVAYNRFRMGQAPGGSMLRRLCRGNERPSLRRQDTYHAPRCSLKETTEYSAATVLLVGSGVGGVEYLTVLAPPV